MVLRLFERNRIYRPSEYIDGYRLQKIIGEGRYGICYQADKGEKPYILKQLKRRVLKKIGEKTRFEVDILKALHHKNIPRFIDKIDHKAFCGYVLEFKEGKTFEDIIYLDRHVFERKEIYRIGCQLMGILRYLHSRGIVHRDIRVPNTLYDGQKVTLVDFGLARWIDDNDTKYTPAVDFAFLGDFLLHLYYTSFAKHKGRRTCPWYNELNLSKQELYFLKRLMGIEERYDGISEIERDFLNAFESCS